MNKLFGKPFFSYPHNRSNTPKKVIINLASETNIQPLTDQVHCVAD